MQGPYPAPVSEPTVLQRFQAANEIARQAGALLLGHLGRLAGYDEKSAINLVTVADRQSEAHVAKELSRRFPDDTLVLEESDGTEGARRRRAEIEAAPYAWCVDPLDGTTNFVHGYPVFAVSIGLLAHGKPVAGVIHAPARNETFAGGLGLGATLNGAPIRVTATTSVARALLGTGFPYDRRERTDALLAIVKQALLSAHDIRRSGAAALDLCDVAAGRLDGFFEQGLAPWDVAAEQVVASNGAIQEDLLAMIARAR
jgi:myo-inositol-1(or 4)-monophosphatase